jgi:hypothetical protein
MKKYKWVEVNETQLEELIRQGTELIEEGLVFVDHQRMTDRGPLDVLMVDSGGALVLAELKVHEDDKMLMQALDYYDWVVRHAEAFTRLYKKHKIKPTQTPRLFLIAPSFSITLLTRCKWIDVPISLYTYKCIQMEGDTDIVPVFAEQAIPPQPVTVEANTIEENLDYITDKVMRELAVEVLEEIQAWETTAITIDAVKHDISVKVSGRVLSYLSPRRKHFLLSAKNPEGNWTNYPIHQKDDWPEVKALLKLNVESIGNITIKEGEEEKGGEEVG